jgi:rare lipoprotein A
VVAVGEPVGVAPEGLVRADPAGRLVADPAGAHLGGRGHRPRRRRGERSRRSALRVARRNLAAPSGTVLVVRGVLEPAHQGARVRLIARAGHAWRTLGYARTRRSGHFGIRYQLHGAGASAIRVAFAGSRFARPASALAGRIIVLTPAIASWYDDAGNTACGFHARYGIASRTLPCGTHVTLSYGGRTVVATVDDRGPYVYGRTFDLNQNTAGYLGMWGVAQVYACAGD